MDRGKRMTKNLDPTKSNLTTDQGAPVGDNQNSMTAGVRGPVFNTRRRLIRKISTL